MGIKNIKDATVFIKHNAKCTLRTHCFDGQEKT